MHHPTGQEIPWPLLHQSWSTGWNKKQWTAETQHSTIKLGTFGGNDQRKILPDNSMGPP